MVSIPVTFDDDEDEEEDEKMAVVSSPNVSHSEPECLGDPNVPDDSEQVDESPTDLINVKTTATSISLPSPSVSPPSSLNISANSQNLCEAALELEIPSPACEPDAVRADEDHKELPNMALEKLQEEAPKHAEQPQEVDSLTHKPEVAAESIEEVNTPSSGFSHSSVDEKSHEVLNLSEPDVSVTGPRLTSLLERHGNESEQDQEPCEGSALKNDISVHSLEENEEH